MKPKVYVFDIDGCLADSSHRRHVVKNWSIASQAEVNAWGALTPLDRPIMPMVHLARMCHSFATVVLLTSRCKGQEAITREWLDVHEIPYSHIYMREVGERTPNHIYKSRQIDLIREDYRIAMAFDDEPGVVDTFRQKGVICLQVPYNVFPYGESTVGITLEKLA